MISITVVTHNMQHYSRRCIQSILENTDVEAELTIVDSGSSDGTQEWLRGIEPRGNVRKVDVKLFDENVGAAIGYNAGFEAAQSDTIVRIDSDVIVPCGWASVLVDDLHGTDRLGMVCTVLEFDPDQRGVRVERNRHVSLYEHPVWHDGGLGSWCMAIRREVFAEVGYYRDLYGPYALQDNDLERRAQRAGWKLGCTYRVTVGHLWRRDTAEEVAYTDWKFAEQQKAIEVWKTVWGDEPN